MTTTRLTTAAHYPLPADLLWQVVADLDGYADHVGSLQATEVLDGAGVGAVRRCTTARHDSWTETVTDWEEGRRYRLEVATDTYPFPLRALFRSFAGTWSVEPDDEGCTVTMTFDADVRAGRLLAPLVALLRRRMAADLDVTLASYGRAATALAGRTTRADAESGVDR